MSGDKEEKEKELAGFAQGVERYQKAVEKAIKGQPEARLSAHYYQKGVANALADTGSMIQASGVRAAQQAHADPTWFTEWAKEELPDLVAQGNIKAQIALEKRENTWLNRAKKAFWYIVGIIVTAIVTYYVALAGFKV